MITPLCSVMPKSHVFATSAPRTLRAFGARSRRPPDDIVEGSSNTEAPLRFARRRRSDPDRRRRSTGRRPPQSLPQRAWPHRVSEPREMSGRAHDESVPEKHLGTENIRRRRSGGLNTENCPVVTPFWLSWTMKFISRAAPPPPHGRGASQLVRNTRPSPRAERAQIPGPGGSGRSNSPRRGSSTPKPSILANTSTTFL